MFEVGAIYSYSYLWARQRDAGEESRRKDRPVCLLLRPAAYPGVLILFPITSRQPTLGRTADAIPAGVPQGPAGCAGVVILDEYNVALEAAPYDFASLEAQGEFSGQYLKKPAGIVARLVAEKKLSKVVRR